MTYHCTRCNKLHGGEPPVPGGHCMSEPPRSKPVNNLRAKVLKDIEDSQHWSPRDVLKLADRLTALQAVLDASRFLAEVRFEPGDDQERAALAQLDASLAAYDKLAKAEEGG